MVPAAGSTPASVAAAAETGECRGGHRPGAGRLGADAYTGAERVECRHEELAVEQRCPVCGQGTLYALPPSVEIHIDPSLKTLVHALWNYIESQSIIRGSFDACI